MFSVWQLSERTVPFSFFVRCLSDFTRFEIDRPWISFLVRDGSICAAVGTLVTVYIFGQAIYFIVGNKEFSICRLGGTVARKECMGGLFFDVVFYSSGTNVIFEPYVWFVLGSKEFWCAPFFVIVCRSQSNFVGEVVPYRTFSAECGVCFVIF